MSEITDDDGVQEEETRRVEITEENGVREGKVKYHFGDKVTLPKSIADKFIGLGWAKCDTTGEQGERRPGVQSLEVHAAVQEG